MNEKELNKYKKSDLISKVLELSNRVNELENNTSDVNINRVNIILGKNKFNRDFKVNIYKPIDNVGNDKINFEFTESIVMIPGASNSFGIELLK